MRKIILSIIGLLLIVASFFYAKKLIADKNRPKPVQAKVVKTVFTDTIQNSVIPIVIAANGSLEAKRRLEIYAEVQGIFKQGSKLFKPGQEYRAGQTLIKVDAAEYYASVQSAKSNLYNSIAAIMPDLRLDFPDIFNKWQNYLSSFDLNKTTPKLPEMTSDKENYFITGRSIVSNYYNVKNLEQRLAKYSITAPFSGILTEALVTEGTLIRSGQKLGEFIDPSVYEMEVAVSKIYANLLKVGEDVALNNLDKTENYKGKVSRVNGSIDPTTQTITAYIEVKNTNLKEGMYLEANLNAKEESDAIEIDRNLLLETQQIYVVKDTLLDVIDVKPIYFSDTKVVLKNVPNGTVILKKPVPGAYAGMLVKSFEEQSEAKDQQ
ncbi:HlyD family efflux transporter periplasmic adaptor subunit [Algibacter amylolyticus]|uniref:HlyD family efflux transporter periplasmic adaptor subunit n=1 Tax=Algibacter amylolyticus TaxID=1608400 RepID=A0A5M7BGF1_9FLAO|nr:HlyD family efflux transporter periplasmic adaptor subunit [Algibacter amylolyticus]KAA5826265.1 HlyD family efflux transporter periplasmic adaptor subunit [Algibacter amylolyticus]MBB5268468.1 multidrug efflux pump subunit AcrA (membrane-fusion protein) [Algibacter amylolyticus]TSJ80303.1 HlyD family efflux transporter periplasmic adaptor subunit [Algibacter amylolyticus]